MDSAVENSLCGHMLNGIVKFKSTQEGLYVWKPTDKFKSKIETLKQKKRQLETRLSKSKEGMSNLVSTVKENRLGYTKRQYERCKTRQKSHPYVRIPDDG